MSLIDEALKRAELEAARRDGLRGGPYPWIPEHTPPKRRKWATLVLFAVVAGIVAAGVMWLRRESARNPASGPKSQGETRAGIRPPSSATAMDTVEVAPPRSSAPAPRLTPRPLPAEGQERLASDLREEVRGKKDQPGVPGSSHAAPSRSGAPSVESASPGHPLANGKTYVGEVAVPDAGKIALEGIVYSESSPVALINGKVLPPGGVVEEFTIVSISSDRVELNGRGLTIFLALK